MNDLIGNTVEFVKEFLKDNYSGHDYYHTLRVYKIATKIAEKENADIELTSLIALLHEIDDFKVVGKDSILLKNTKLFLNNNNINQEKINLICDEITKISFKGSGISIPKTLEGKIVQDADRIDAMGAMGIARTFAYGGSIGRTIYSPEIKIRDYVSEKDYYNNSGTSIGHFYEKLLKILDLINTEEAKKIAIHRHNFLLQYLDEFFEEWDGKK